MSDSTWVTFRGEEALVEFRVCDDAIEWWFGEPEMKGIVPTDAEDEAIEAHVSEIVNDPHRWDESDLRD